MIFYSKVTNYECSSSEVNLFSVCFEIYKKRIQNLCKYSIISISVITGLRYHYRNRGCVYKCAHVSESYNKCDGIHQV